MDRPRLLPGDRFGVNAGSALAGAINAAQGFWAADGEARFNHLGLIVTPWGRTFEALWTYRFNDLACYFNRPLIIFRDESTALAYRQKRLGELVAKYIGKRYPVRQILAHIFPPLARSTLAPPVCSELEAIYEVMLGEATYWKGVNPDGKVDEWRIRDRADGPGRIIYEGRWLWDDRPQADDPADCDPGGGRPGGGRDLAGGPLPG